MIAVTLDPIIQNGFDPEMTLTSMYEEHLSNLEDTADGEALLTSRKPRAYTHRLVSKLSYVHLLQG